MPTPEIKPDEVLVRVEAAALNPLDDQLKAGKMAKFFPLPFPYTLGTDLTGTVAHVGAEVTAWQPGDRVIGRLKPATGGALAEFAALPADACAALPPSLPLSAAAGIPTAAGTAWLALFKTAGLKEGQTVLIHAGAGGVGSFAVQFAHAVGARVLATASGDGIEAVRNLGADQVIDYKSEDFVSAVPDVDVVLDTVGGETQTRSFEVLKSGGYLVSTVSPPDEETVRAKGVSVSMVQLTRDGVPLQTLVAEIQDKSIEVLVDQTFSVAQIGEALAVRRRATPTPRSS